MYHTRRLGIGSGATSQTRAQREFLAKQAVGTVTLRIMSYRFSVRKNRRVGTEFLYSVLRRVSVSVSGLSSAGLVAHGGIDPRPLF